MKTIIRVFLLITLLISLTACSKATVSPTVLSPIATESALLTNPIESEQQVTAAIDTSISVEYDADDLDIDMNTSDMTTLTLKGDSIEVVGGGVNVEDQIATITSGGTYQLSGVLENGQIVVDTKDDIAVQLILNGVNITSKTSVPIYIIHADKVMVTLGSQTENYLTDGATYTSIDENEEPDAALFSKSDMTINGDGALIVKANYNNGITSKDDLKIVSGTITINAVNDGIRGRDSIVVKDGVVTINAGGDGLQSNNDEDGEKGYVLIEAGTFSITANNDGIQAETRLIIQGGHFVITTGGGSIAGSAGVMGMQGNTNQTSDSAKGLKAGVALVISDGSFEINAMDDALHSNDNITIHGGVFTLSTSDDAIHADILVTINGGDLNMTQSYEGIESESIVINNGTIHLVSSDDGFNTTASDSSTTTTTQQMPGRGGGGFETGGGSLYINGGYIYVNAGGDGLDSNGPITKTGGTVIVNGPTNNGNGSLDYLNAFNISGGYLLAVGSSGMAEAPSASSSQYSLMYNFTAMQAAGTMLHIETESGESILTFTPEKNYQSVVFSSPQLTNGTNYVIYTDGNASGTQVDGLYSDESYSGGTFIANPTLSGIVTIFGAQGGGFPGAPGGGRRP